MTRVPLRRVPNAPVGRPASVALGLASALCALCSAVSVSADTPQKTAADELFTKGYALILAGKQAEGCAIVQQSVDLEASLTAEDVLVDCDQALNRPGRAGLESSRLTLRLSVALKGTGDPERRARLEKMLRDAETRAAALAPKLAALPVLTLVLPPAERALADLAVELDGIALAPAQWAAPLPVDPGHHVLRARARGKRPFAAEIDVTTAPVTVPVALVDEQPASPTASVSPTATLAPTATLPPTATLSPTASAAEPTALPWLTGREIGIGASLATSVVGFAIGAGFGAAFVGARDAYPRDCARGAEWCRDGTSSDKRYQEAIDLRTTEIIGLVAGGVGLGAAGLLWFALPETAGRPGKPTSATKVCVGPAGLRLTGSF